VRLRLLLVDPDAAFRLRGIAALRLPFDVTVPQPGDDVIRVARAVRPDVGLFAAGGRARVEALRLTRVLKTDVRVVPAIGLYGRTGEAPPPEAAVHAAHADGFLPNAEDMAAFLGFAQVLSEGRQAFPEPWPAPARGPVHRVLNRLLRGG
jgi:hypothetical protein